MNRRSKYYKKNLTRFRLTFLSEHLEDLPIELRGDDEETQKKFHMLAEAIICDPVFHSDEEGNDPVVRNQPKWRTSLATKMLDVVDSLVGQRYERTERQYTKRKLFKGQIAYLSRAHLAPAVSSVILHEEAEELGGDDGFSVLSTTTTPSRRRPYREVGQQSDAGSIVSTHTHKDALSALCLLRRSFNSLSCVVALCACLLRLCLFRVSLAVCSFVVFVCLCVAVCPLASCVFCCPLFAMFMLCYVFVSVFAAVSLSVLCLLFSLCSCCLLFCVLCCLLSLFACAFILLVS